MWKNFLMHPVDIAIQFLLSFMFIGIFVAESSGSVLSASIVSDTTALTSSPQCFAPYLTTNVAGRALSYSRQCYNASEGSEGCNYYYNQSIGYTSESSDDCPWEGNRCALLKNTSYSLDTGHVHTKYIGINAPERYTFRKRTTCAPLTQSNNFEGALIPGYAGGSLNGWDLPRQFPLGFSIPGYVYSRGLWRSSEPSILLFNVY